MFRQYIKSIVKSRIFYLCIFVSTIILVAGAYQILVYAKDNVISLIECLFMSLDAIGIFAVVAPVLSSITYLFFYTEQLEKRAMYYQIIRMNRKNYFVGQVLGSIMSSLLVSLIAVISFAIICFAFGVTWNDAGWFTMFDQTNLYEYIHADDNWKITIWYCFLTVLYCLPWPLFGMIMSLVTNNKYVIIACPFVIFMGWNYATQLLYGVFHNILWIMPTQPLLCMGLVSEPYWSIELTILYPVIYHIILIGGLSMVFLMVTRRRFLREGI